MTWDVDIVLSHIRGMEDNEELSSQLLSHDLAMLLALTNADRCFDLAALDLTYQSFQGNGVKFIIPGFETQWPTKGGLLSSICTSSKAMSSSDPSVL